jgi:4-amino-4-deoxy-L-arabinose transferase-like glycosyltransferase
MTRYFQSWPGLVLLWLLLCLLALITRPLLPVDETRYVAVAWEMWQRGDFLVPYLNGEPYSHKPPLFFWLVHTGWAVFGVNEWWPRLIGPLSALLVLYQTSLLARRLWPEENRSAAFVPWILFGSVFFTAFYTWVQMDMLLVASVLVALTGVINVVNGKRSGWLIAGLGMGVGLLAKGPLVLLHVLPVALLAPLWLERLQPRPRHPGWASWYSGVFISVVIAAVIALAWALPAAQAGGADYRQAILWGQTAGRVASSFAHAHPFWWYIPWLPVLFAPWCLFPGFWRHFGTQMKADHGSGSHFLLYWIVSVFVLLSLISGKQAKYLLPLLPAFALLVSRVMATAEGHPLVWIKGLAGLLVIVGGLLAALPMVPGLPDWLQQVNPGWGLLISAAGLFLLVRPVQVLDNTPVTVALLSGFVIVVVHLGFFRAAAPAYDLETVSALIAQAHDEQRVVVNMDNYHGQFHFPGRLVIPIERVSREDALAWAERHPEGYIVTYPERKWLRKYRAARVEAIYSQPYRSGALMIWEGRQLVRYPQVLLMY